MPRKTVQILAHEFDSLPAHVTVSGRGSGANLRVACQRAIADVFKQASLRHKQTGMFKCSFVVIAEVSTRGKTTEGVLRGSSIVPAPCAAADDALGTPQEVIDRRPTYPGNKGGA